MRGLKSRLYQKKPIAPKSVPHNESQLEENDTSPYSLHAMQRGKLMGAQRQAVINNLANGGGDRALQRWLATSKQPNPTSEIARKGKPKEADPAYTSENITADIPEHIRAQIHSANDEDLLFKLGAWHLKGQDELTAENRKETVEFFKNIKKVDVPGNLWMHQGAKERLEAVNKVLEKKGLSWPKTDVGQSFRGNLGHEHKTGRFHAHKLGFAVDFNAATNSMIVDGRMARLIQVVGGGSSNLNLSGGHREKLHELGKKVTQAEKENKSPEELDFVKQFLKESKFEEEFDRVSGVNAKFVGSLNAGIKESLATLRTQYIQLHDGSVYKNLLKQVATAQKTKKKDPAEQAAVEAELKTAQAELDKLTESIRKQIAVLLKPWIDLVRAKKEAVKKELDAKQALEQAQSSEEQQKILADLAEFKSKQEGLNAEILELTAQKNKKELSKKKSELKGLGRSGRDIDKRQKKFLDKQKKKDTKAQADYDYWVWLEDSLAGKSYKDLDFVLGLKEKDNEVRDASALQLVRVGFFNVYDNEKASGEEGAEKKPDPEKSKHNFNRTFARQMLLHGFGWGAAWNPTSQDTMHFELAEWVDNLPSTLAHYGKQQGG